MSYFSHLPIFNLVLVQNLDYTVVCASAFMHEDESRKHDMLLYSKTETRNLIG